MCYRYVQIDYYSNSKKSPWLTDFVFEENQLTNWDHNIVDVFMERASNHLSSLTTLYFLYRACT